MGIVEKENHITFTCDECGFAEKPISTIGEIGKDKLRVAKSIMGINGNDWRFNSRKFGKPMTLCPNCFYGKESNGNGQ